MGLAYICFQSDLDAGFRTVQTRLNGEPLEEGIKPFGGDFSSSYRTFATATIYLAKGLVERRAV